MNRKAKIAYLQMVIGVILFSIGFILFLNFNLSDWYAKERHSYISNNFTQLTLVLNDYKKGVVRGDVKYLKELEIESYFVWYCLSKRTPNSNYRAIKSYTSTESHKAIIVENLNEFIETKFYYLKKFFSFIICSSDRSQNS